jgi:hypothetical protein
VSGRLIVLTRFPVPGKTKTRLEPALGPGGAAALHRILAERTVLTGREACARLGVELEIRHDAPGAGDAERWLGRDLALRPQGAGGLGDRMARALRTALAEGAGPAVLVGTDCPGLDVPLLAEAFRSLGEADAVFGPCPDGGYYLVGLREFRPALFEGVPWGGGEVLARSLDAARREGLRVRLLPERPDVDRPSDLDALPPDLLAEARGRAPPAPAASVVVPTRGEGKILERTLASARDPRAETIVVDAGEGEGAREHALAAGARFLAAGPHRASRLNAGALAARGPVLLFLHADTILPAGWLDEVLRLVRPDGRSFGAFPLAVDGPGPWLRALERLVALRTRLLAMPYGDQALFLPARLFWECGGFAGLPLMEDYELVRRLRRRAPLRLGRRPVRTSDRRWRALGVLRATAVTQAVIAGWHLGVDPARLAAWYRAGGTARDR